MFLPLILKTSNTILVLVGLIGFFGIIVLVVLLFRKKLHLNEEKPSDESKLAEENLSRLLHSVDDKKTQKQFEEFDKKNDKKEN